MSSVDKIKWAMSLRDPQYEALKCFDNISSKIEYKTASKSEAEKVASENCQELHKIVVDKEFDFPSFCFDMTTGIGKTRLMGACIYYLYKTKGYKHFFTGNHPQRPNAIKKICKKKIVPSQRGASNVYFPVTRTAISIPPWTNPINDLMAEHRRDIDLLIEVLGRDAGLNKSYEKYFEGKFTRDEFNEAYNRLEQNIKDYVELKEMEYNAITHHQQVEFQHDVRYFKAEEVAIKDSLKKYFSRVIKLHRLREVKVLLGYSRLEMPEPEVDDQKQVVKLKSSGPEKWLPAVEINGEGMSKGEFNSVAQANGGLENMINWEGKDKDLLALIKYIAEEDKLEKVLENPQVIKTPVVRNGKQSTLGYQPDIWKAWK